ncbi:PRC-barrel domain-containing protein [Aureimonas sp. AU4]|uniref:PRC-barrel domain-containing protein n=1 Tax=Aureimonas sp. AU4 TaxID=1638163 RepID=UPI0009EB53C9|nr:PRC-barrel domain-containing protein [Aureimonas sp. AU4]
MKLLATTLLLSATVLTGPTLAQAPSGTRTVPAPGATSPASPGTTAPAPTTGTAPATSAGSGASTPPSSEDQEASAANTSATAEQNQDGFLTYRQGDQMLGSGLMGAQVAGAAGENIGEVSDLVLDREGQVVAVVVGVGGFLGLGEKDVAIANDQLSFVLRQDAEASGTGTTSTTAGAATAPGTAAFGTGEAAGTSAATGSGTADGTAPADGTTNPEMAPSAANSRDSLLGTRRGAMNRGWNWTGSGIDRIQVNFTREQLEAAPAFKDAD